MLGFWEWQVVTAKPSSRKLGQISGLLAVVLSLLNAEEIWFDLPVWTAKHLFALAVFDERVYFVAVVLVTTVAWAIVIAAWRDGANNILMAIVALLSAALAVNGLSHTVLSIATGTLMPGVVTAVALLLPIATYCFVVLIQRMQLSWRGGVAFFLAGGVVQVVVPLALLSMIDVWI